MAERSKTEGVSASTLVRDALNLFLGIDGRAPDRVHRSFKKLPATLRTQSLKPNLSNLARAMEILDGNAPYSPEEEPGNGTPPPTDIPARVRTLVLSRTKKPKTRPLSVTTFGTKEETTYTIKADPDGGLTMDLHLPYRKVLKFWNSLPDDSTGGKPLTHEDIRQMGPRVGLTPLEAYELFGCLEWDGDLRERLMRDEKKMKGAK